MAKILVTGSGGYIGRHVVKALIDAGHNVIAASSSNNGVDDRATKINCSIFDLGENAYKHLKEPEICLHMAWRDGCLHNSEAHVEDLSAHFVFFEKHDKQRS